VVIVAQTFLEEIPPDLAALVQAIENDNKELAYQFSHKMKPNLEMFGIDVKKSITSIEAWTKTNKNSATVKEHINHLTQVLANVFEELKEDYPS
jgi:HPt (histidine-containing phosphotransfer) domain-containing protein